MSRIKKDWKAIDAPKKGAAYMRSLGKVYYGAWVSKELREQVKAAAAKQNITAERYVTLSILSMLGLSQAFDEGAASSPVRPALYDLADEANDEIDVEYHVDKLSKPAKRKAVKSKPVKAKPAKRKAVK